MTKPKKKVVKKATCKECGKDFTQRRDWQHFCSDRCRFRNFIENKSKKIKKYNEEFSK
jgi:endogenous inhibitor of DNA gyrase (YacG/DUF329 family)